MLHLLAGIFAFSRASASIDLLALSLAVIVPLMLMSIALVRYKKLYALHKAIQLSLGGLLLLVVLLFEIDIRMRGWRQYAQASPYFPTVVNPVLYVHIAFSVSTTLLWIYTIVAALKRFAGPPAPGAHSRRHRLVGRLAALTMIATGVTGWTFYWLAFVAT